MKIKDLFITCQGNGLELINLDTSEQSNINFVSRTAHNNGVVAQVETVENIAPFDAGLITVALGGSVLSSFVQIQPFYTAYHIMVLKPKKKMSLAEKLFYCMCIEKNAYRYSYGRQANKTLKNIELPDTIPDWVYTIPIAPITTDKKAENALPLDTSKWIYFTIDDEKGGLFSLERCKNKASGDLLDGNDCYYLGAKKSDNCVMRRVTREDSLVTKGNCIVFIGNGQGSVGYSNYMNEDFIGTADLTVGYNEHLNPFIGLFIVTVLDLERPKYSFGRKWSARIADTRIKLPATDKGTPDWDYMERYIKSLPYSDRI